MKAHLHRNTLKTQELFLWENPVESPFPQPKKMAREVSHVAWYFYLKKKKMAKLRNF